MTVHIFDGWSGWLTCADCSSLGMDTSIGRGTPPKTGECAACGGEWPRRISAGATDAMSFEDLWAQGMEEGDE